MKKILKNIFGMKIKRTTDLIATQGREAFWRTGIELDAKLTSILVTLYEGGAGTSSEISNATGLSRQLVEKRLRLLEKKAYIVSNIKPSDARKRLYSIGPARKAEIENVVKTMRDFEKVYEDLWQEIGVDLGEAMVKMEKALQSRPLLSRLCTKFPKYNNLIKVRINDH